MNKNQLITSGIVVLVTASLTVGVFTGDIGNQSKSILSKKTAVTDNLPASQEVFQLSFKDYKTENNVVELYKSSIKAIAAEKQLSGSTFFTFIKTDDLENLHTGVKIGGRLFDLGKTSMMGRSNDLVQICEAEVLGKKYVKITGILGANYAESSYFSVGEKLPSLFLRVNAVATEIDIDSDGVKEIVSSYGTASCTDIYKLNEDKVKVANINETLNAQAVFLSDNKLFEAYFKGKPNQPTFFQLTKEGTLKKVANSQSIDAGRMSPYSPYSDNITISSVPNIPSVQRQTTRICLTDEEVRKIPEYGIP